MGARELIQDLSEAGLTIKVDGANLIVSPRELLTDDLRNALKANKAGLLAILTAPPAPDKQTSENQTLAAAEATAALLRRLRGAGLDGDTAAQVAGWARARDGDADDRRLCVECAHFGERGKSCRHPDLVAIQAPRDLGRLATTPQRCGGFTEI